MADVATNATRTSLSMRQPGATRDPVLVALLVAAILLCAAKPILPDFLVRLPETWIPPLAEWLDAFFDVITGDMQHGRFGLIYITRWFAEGPLDFLLGVTANLLESDACQEVC